VPDQPSKFFTSREEFQQSSSDRFPDLSGVPDITDLVDAFERLAFSPDADASATHGVVEDASESPLSNATDRISACSLPPSDSSLPPTRPLPYNRSARKQDRDRRSTRAHEVLDAITLRISTSMAKLAPTTSHETLCSLESELIDLRSGLDVGRSVESVAEHQNQVSEMLEQLEARVVELRNTMPYEIEGPIDFDTSKRLLVYVSFFPTLMYSPEHHFDDPINRTGELAQVAIFIGVVCSVIMHVGRQAGDLVMRLIHTLIRKAFEHKGGPLRPTDEHILKQIPLTIQQALSRFNLDGRTTIYAVCPACHCTYKPHGRVYPKRCTNKPIPESDGCNHALLDEDKKPIKTFVYHEFQDYLAGLLANKDIEEMMDKICDDLKESPDQPEFVKNVFEADFVRSFEGHEKGKLFVDRGSEGRYLFALNVDFFNVDGLSLRGASTSCGVISMSCLNLPVHMRHDSEYMYLAGIIPGPREPHLTDINHYLRPLVDDLVPAFERGIRFSRTATFPQGRITRSAVAAAVNDLIAARKVSATSPPKSHHYCTVCSCYHLTTLGRTDFHHQDWKRLDKDTLRQYAEQWRDASSSTEQKKLFKEHGIRYSELWRLSYWDPPRQLVVDSMHCVLGGLAEFQARFALILTTTSAKAKPEVPSAFGHDFRLADNSGMTEKDIKQVVAIHKLLVAAVQDDDENDIEASMTTLEQRLLHKNKPPLKWVCDDLGLHPTHRIVQKIHYAEALVDWVSAKYHVVVSRGLMLMTQRKLKPMEASHTPLPKIATPPVLQHIRDVVRDTDTPSWLNSVPHNFGDAAAGTLKADEWRTMITIYLPIALILLWGEGSPHPTPDEAAKFRRILDHTMALVSAVIIVCRRTTSRERAELYRTYMATWVRELTDIHTHTHHHPNNHMALHIYDFLLLFGPVHSWWCFPFERLIGIIQRQPHNHKFGRLHFLAL
jgi:hypothetical protein